MNQNSARFGAGAIFLPISAVSDGHSEDIRRPTDRQLDIRELKRKALIEPGRQFSLQWSRGGEVTASINLRIELDRVILSYWRRGSNGQWTSEEYPV
jgi:hypothetical protein